MGLCLFRRSSNGLKSEVPPPISMTNACSLATRSSGPQNFIPKVVPFQPANGKQPAAPQAITRRLGKPASSAAVMVCCCGPASKENGEHDS